MHLTNNDIDLDSAENAQSLAVIEAPASSALANSDLADGVRFAIQESRSSSTRRAYRAKWESFEAFCQAHGVQPLPAAPDVVAAFLVDFSEGRKLSTVRQALAAIGAAHEDFGASPLPTKHAGVKRTMAGLARTLGAAVDKKKPLVADLTKEAASIAARKGSLMGKRDRALILLGFGGAFRRSEIEGLLVENLTFTDDGLDVRLERSKTDQTGEGVTVSIVRGGRHCPVEAVEGWIEAAGISSGPLFVSFYRGDVPSARPMSGRSISRTVKEYAQAIGCDPAEFGAHSMRAGFITSAAANGATVDRIRDVSRHKSVNVLMGYVRHAKRFENHAGQGLL